MTIAEMLYQTAKAHAQILSCSTEVPALAQNLGSIRGRPIRVWSCPKGEISRFVRESPVFPGETEAYGTAFQSDDVYDLVIDKNGYPSLNAALGPEGLRFIVLEEYAHVLHGDLPEQRYAPEQTEFDICAEAQFHRERDRFAKGYAFERFLAELADSKKLSLADAVAYNFDPGLNPPPSSPEYKATFPDLV